MAKELSFKELAELESGTILEDAYENGVRYLIVRGPCALCAYVGVPLDHPLAGRSYEGINLDCHYGLTFAKEGAENNYRPAGWFWYGWDYGHLGDRSFYDLKDGWDKGSIEWTVPMVREQIWHVTYNFKKLMALVENVARDTQKDKQGSSVASKGGPEDESSQ